MELRARHRRAGATPRAFEHMSSFRCRPAPSRVARRASPNSQPHEHKRNPSFGQTDIVKLSDEDAAVALLERAVTGLWEVVNELTRLRRTTRQNYRVTIFGSARLKPGSAAYGSVKSSPRS